MFHISAMSPPSTPRGSVFSPRQESPMSWSFRTISLASPGKRIKLDTMLSLNSPSTNSSRRLAAMPMSPGLGSNKSTLLRSATLASRRMKRGPPSALPLNIAKMAPAVVPPSQSTGLSPIVKDLSLGISSQHTEAKLETPALPVEETKPAPQPMQFRLQKPAPKKDIKPAPKMDIKPVPQPQTFRLQKPAPTKESKAPIFRLQKPAPTKESKAAPFRLQKPAPVEESKPAPAQMRFRLQKPTPAKADKGSKVPKLNIAPTGLISPPSVSTPSVGRGRGRPPALSLAAAPLASAGIEMSPSSPFMPQTPGAGPAPLNLIGDAMFGEASPSLYAQPTPPPIAGAPTFMFTPPSPAVVASGDATTETASDAASDESVASGGLRAPVTGSATLSPCTPPWPKSGSSLRKTIFDHIGKSQLSPMDLRGYMAISMNS